MEVVWSPIAVWFGGGAEDDTHSFVIIVLFGLRLCPLPTLVVTKLARKYRPIFTHIFKNFDHIFPDFF